MNKLLLNAIVQMLVLEKVKNLGIELGDVEIEKYQQSFINEERLFVTELSNAMGVKNSS